MRPVSRARLRTKTGCLTCRQRKKKCDETTPVCGECIRNRRSCQWPGSRELVDRRFAVHEASRYWAASAELGHAKTSPLVSISTLLAESGAAHALTSREMPVVLARHFLDRYFDLILLPTCHRSFRDDWLVGIKQLMHTHECLFYSVLACSASHIYLLDNNTPTQSLALRYYTKATGALSARLKGSPHPEDDDGLLMSVMLLYLHGVSDLDKRPWPFSHTDKLLQCIGLGTYVDIPIHVNAAVRILRARILDRRGRITSLFDRVAIESVLFQIFLLMTGLWSQPPQVDCAIDATFWGRAEDVLKKCDLFPGAEAAESLNSPVLGVSASLLTLSTLLRQQFGRHALADAETMRRARDEVEDWERTLLLPDDPCPAAPLTGTCNDHIYKDVKLLYSITVSLLFRQLSRRNQACSPSPLPEPGSSWQVRKAISIIQRHKGDVAWTRCFVGNWPVYTLGFLTEAPEDQQIIRDDLQERLEATGFAQIPRFQADLEETWSQRRNGEISVSF
ncbi:uncharacterized protein B0I36DRAFT_32328 [Microdochium trichocladiopsis]|uniref:Zn(2)-C6 fungal-type domain-containing protein n=1 Tax=Microdochium trichocladiopsis TaxID=1682393 RepID=A0A9P9BP31_9PEZI|nr:uncharacterized protein B0I36DRAFT_32328 [Microdochium trichocladiopsis]KAH7021478.1 hypothetical protein B0I36DRAFT_32328 [Microdochium trichocladiopsis]